MDGIELKIARIRAGIPQFRVAQQAGLRANELSLIENDRVVTKPEKLARITDALRRMGAAMEE